MGSLVKLGATLAFNPMTMVQDVLASVRRTAILIVCALVAGLIVLPAIGCLMAALWIFVQERLGPFWAAIITAAAMLLLAITVLLIGILQSKAGKKTRAQRDAPRSAAAASLSALPPPKAMLETSRSAFRRNKGTVLLAAGVAGLLLGQDLLRPRPQYVVEQKGRRRR
ncbi:phage holin family protein [Acidisoma sp. L85]|uniref:phage holin family protein n=1 Tax=Acidisoma sp. L85 TaxID=1641850 RepID=UPI00131B7051|nr:phage holin family protein [Acidisoma sp. L85]